MPTSPLDSAIYADLFGDREIRELFTDSAEVRAMLLVEGALAKAQGAAGVIPEVSAAAIHRAAMEVQIDPVSLAEETARSGVVVPALVSEFRKAMAAPEHAQFVHWGATSQDIMDTALTLRLKRALEIVEGRLREVLAALADMAEAHADTPMAGRTYGQVATPTSFGAVVMGWGAPLMGPLARLDAVRDGLLSVSLSGAAGTSSVMGDDAPKVRAAMAEALGLRDPGGSWHSNRNVIAHGASWMTEVLGALGKIGEDLLLMTQGGIGEVTLSVSGGSSTMPQKANPVAPSALVALARQGVGLNAVLQGAALHRQQRDGAAWFSEWLSLVQLVQTLGGATRVAAEMVPEITPNAERMRELIDADGLGLIYAEAASFALTAWLPRPEAQATVKAACKEATASRTPLIELLARDFPDLDAGQFTPERQLVQAPAEARAFASAVRAL